MKIFSFDAETDGLWGQIFAIGAVVYQDGQKIAEFYGRHDYAPKNEWVRENVLPNLRPATHDTYQRLIQDFGAFYMLHKLGADVVTHMGYIVEAHLLREMRMVGAMGEWEAPYPLFDVSGNLQAAGYDPTSVDTYAAKFGITAVGATHCPVFDADITAQVYINLRK